MNSKLDPILKEPYRVFIPLAVCFSLFGLGVWFVYWLFPHLGFPYYPHANLQMRGVMPLFIYGILLTLLPKLLHLKPISALGFFAILICFAGIFISALAVISMGMELSYSFLITLIIYYFWRRRKDIAVPFPREFYLLHVAFFVNLLFSLLRLAAEFSLDLKGPLMLAAHRFQIHGFIYLIFLGMGAFLIPKMFLSPDYVALYMEKLKKRKRSSGGIFILLGMAFSFSYIIESFITPLDVGMRIAAGFRLFLNLYFYQQIFMIHRWPKNQPQILKWGWTAIWAIPLSQFASALYPVEYISWDHILYISGFLLVTFSIASKILASHAADTGLLKRYPKAVFSFGFFFLLGMSTRVSCFFVKSYEMHLGVSSLCVLISIFIWARVYLPKTLEIPPYMR